MGVGPERVPEAVASDGFVNKEKLSSRLRQVLPWEEWFSDAGHLEHALRQACLERIEVHHAEYKVNVPVDDFLKMREITFQASVGTANSIFF